MVILKRRLCVLAFALLICASMFLLSSGPAHAATLSGAKIQPFTVSGGGCRADTYVKACNNLDGSGNLIVHWYVLSVASDCSVILTGMDSDSETIYSRRSCTVATYSANFGHVGANHWFQAWTSEDFSNNSYVEAAAPIQRT